MFLGNNPLYGKRIATLVRNPLSLVAPTVTGNLTNGSTLTSTTGSWTGSPSYTYQWKRDGLDIAGQTASTYTYAAATDDGRYISCIVTATSATGNGTAISNAVIKGESALVYATGFDGIDGTNLYQYEGWTCNPSNSVSLRILSNELFLYASSANVWLKDAGNNNHIAKYTLSRNAGDDTNSSVRQCIARATDSNNCLILQFQSNGWQLIKRIAGVNTTIQGFTGITLTDGYVAEIRVNGDYAQVWLNGVHAAQSIAQNGGLGWNVSDLPASSKAGFRPNTNLGGSITYPFSFAKNFELYQSLTNSISINSITTENITGAPGTQRIRLTGVKTGAVTQLQALILSPSGQILMDWTDISGLSGNNFNSVTPQLSQVVEGTTPTVWLRDKINKNVAVSSTVAVSVQAQVVPLTVGMNTVSVAINGTVTGDLMRMAILYVKKNGAFRNVFAPSATVNPASVSYVDATDVGLDSNYFPTIFPSGGSYIGTDYPFYIIDTVAGLPSALHGVYDVTFTPGMRWTLTSSSGAIVRSNYNEAAGTATLTVNGNTGSITEIKFDGYDNGGGYVARTLPTAGNGYFKAIKQGQAAGKVFQPIVATSLGGLSSTGGFTRFMGALNINKEAILNVIYNSRTARRPATAIGLIAQGESITLEDMIEICIETGTNPWICIHDTATPEYVLDVAQTLHAIMPVWMKAAIEYSNEMWNFGGAFGQSTSITERATAAGVSAVVQYSREYKTKILDVFESVFGINSPRLHPILCWQSVINYAQIESMLNEGDIYQKIKGFGIAPYVGGGIGTGADQGDYNNVTIFTKVNRDLILTDAAAFKTAFFAATSIMSGLSQGVWLNFVNMLARYCVSKGLNRTAIRPAAYEYMWQHIVERNTPTAGGQDVLTKQAFAEILRDSRAGDQQDAQNDWLKLTGGDVVGFSHLANPGTSLPSYGSWGYYNNISDTTSEPGVSTVVWVTANT